MKQSSPVNSGWKRGRRWAPDERRQPDRDGVPVPARRPRPAPPRGPDERRLRPHPRRSSAVTSADACWAPQAFRRTATSNKPSDRCPGAGSSIVRASRSTRRRCRASVVPHRSPRAAVRPGRRTGVTSRSWTTRRPAARARPRDGRRGPAGPADGGSGHPGAEVLQQPACSATPPCRASTPTRGPDVLTSRVGPADGVPAHRPH